MKSIFVVIPNWNGIDWIEDCLMSLKAQTIKHTVIVVDNGSIDGSVEIIENKFKEIRLIKLPENTGFSGGVNRGIELAIKSDADAIALLNNDAVTDKNWLKELVLALDKDSDVGIATCKILQMDEKHFDSTGERYSMWGMPFPRGRNMKDRGEYDKDEFVFGASGGASLYRVAMLEEIGIFDERYFAYYEDVDISFRAQLAGWKIVYIPSSRVYHRISATSSKMGLFTRYHATKNFFILYTKNMPGWLFWKYLPLFGLQSLRLFATSLLKGHGYTYIKALVNFIKLLPSILNDRKKIQKNRKVNNEYIDSILYKGRPPKNHKVMNGKA